MAKLLVLKTHRTIREKKDEWISFYVFDSLCRTSWFNSLCLRRPQETLDLWPNWFLEENESSSFIQLAQCINYGPFPGNKPCTTNIPKYIIKIYVEYILLIFIFLQVSIKVYKSKICSHKKESMFGVVRDSDSGTRLTKVQISTLQLPSRGDLGQLFNLSMLWLSIKMVVIVPTF